MKSGFFSAMLMLVFLMQLMCLSAFAGTTIYRCGESGSCIDERVNFGTVQIRCTDAVGTMNASWVCEYEAEYSCRNEMTGEVRTGGFDPLSTSLCERLCGACKAGWKQIK
ncbi:hypothetical protein [Maridesulfovibrio sp.]|uniref:hypothetical protein n=1 Tax=Maridesulfovibrio sp. TaxID=2795000 RepID=UPI002A18C5E9|nr:hypothetical protein [Maridesulfovibrio sp.]